MKWIKSHKHQKHLKKLIIYFLKTIDIWCLLYLMIDDPCEPKAWENTTWILAKLSMHKNHIYKKDNHTWGVEGEAIKYNRQK